MLSKLRYGILDFACGFIKTVSFLMGKEETQTANGSVKKMQVVACLILIFLCGKAARTENVAEPTKVTPSITSTEGFTIDGRIMSGWETSINFFPHQVSLQIGTRHICGAAILNSTTVITAAHCVIEYSQPHLYAIRAGSSQHANGGLYIRAERIIPHQMFNMPTRLNNDIALIFLSKPLVFGEAIQPIEIVQSSDGVHSLAILYVSGWGSTSPYSHSPEENLRYTNVVQMNHQYCAKAYVGVGTVTSSMFCAGSQFGGRDSCQGDSGGPLVTMVNGRMKLFGIVSWGLGCGNANYPGIYTRVSAYNAWVAQTMHVF